MRQRKGKAYDNNRFASSWTIKFQKQDTAAPTLFHFSLSVMKKLKKIVVVDAT